MRNYFLRIFSPHPHYFRYFFFVFTFTSQVITSSVLNSIANSFTQYHHPFNAVKLLIPMEIPHIRWQLYFGLRRNSPTQLLAASLLRFIAHTELHTHTHIHTVERLWMSDQIVVEAANYLSEIRNRDSSNKGLQTAFGRTATDTGSQLLR
jgi:hypothetical protein